MAHSFFVNRWPDRTSNKKKKVLCHCNTASLQPQTHGKRMCYAVCLHFANQNTSHFLIYKHVASHQAFTLKNIQPIMTSEALPFFWWQVIIVSNLAFSTKLVLQTARRGSENQPEDKHLESFLTLTRQEIDQWHFSCCPVPTANIPRQSILDPPRNGENKDSLLHSCFVSLTRRGHYLSQDPL